MATKKKKEPNIFVLLPRYFSGIMPKLKWKNKMQLASLMQELEHLSSDFMSSKREKIVLSRSSTDRHYVQSIVTMKHLLNSLDLHLMALSLWLPCNCLFQ